MNKSKKLGTYLLKGILLFMLILTSIASSASVVKDIELRDGEVIIKKKTVEHASYSVLASGKLYLTNQRLVLKPAFLAVNQQLISIELDDITSVEHHMIDVLVRGHQRQTIAGMRYAIIIHYGVEKEFPFISMYATKKWLKAIEGELENFR
jgi:hypothetical protein|tara:strand:- start:280 stop:732 length:453 start_codon:yes stop_codon:yes gene_type:complete